MKSLGFEKDEPLTLTRDVTAAECAWLGRTFHAGEVVYRFDGTTYGCITDIGIACSIEQGSNPFFELPHDALARVAGTDQNRDSK